MNLILQDFHATASASHLAGCDTAQADQPDSAEASSVDKVIQDAERGTFTTP